MAPDGYHYVYYYPFNGEEVIVTDSTGGEWNGQKPIRSIPYYYHPPKSPGVGEPEMRAGFERWAGPQGLRLDRRDFPGSSRIGQYCSDDTQVAWEAYRAAALGGEK